MVNFGIAIAGAKRRVFDVNVVDDQRVFSVCVWGGGEPLIICLVSNHCLLYLVLFFHLLVPPTCQTFADFTLLQLLWSLCFLAFSLASR